MVTGNQVVLQIRSLRRTSGVLSGVLRRTFSLPVGETRDLGGSTVVPLVWGSPWTLDDQRPGGLYGSPAGLGESLDPG